MFFHLLANMYWKLILKRSQTGPIWAQIDIYCCTILNIFIFSAPQEIHRRENESQREQDEDDDSQDGREEYGGDNNSEMLPSPYEAVLASEPDLNRRPQKSALKKASIGSAPAGTFIIMLLIN